MSARRWWALTGVLLIVAGAAVVVVRPWGAWPWEQGADDGSEQVAPVTAPVERTTLTSRLRLNAQLGYGEPVPLPAASGMLTALPAPGQVVETGHPVYEADGRPVVLFHGTRPFWRDLTVDSDDGEDVRQLEQNLAALGFFDDEVDARYDWVTRQAVRDWQKSLGVPRTGEFSAASVVVADAPGIRVAAVTARLGDSGTSPATSTATTLRAVAKLTAAQARELTAGTPVVVELPDGTEISTTLAAVDPGGVPTGKDDEKTPPTALVEFADQAAVASAGAAAVRIVISDDVESAETLVVPVTALVATPVGYAVEVMRDGEPVRLPAEIGLVADARVQILRSGSEIAEGSGDPLTEGDEAVLAR